MDKKRYPKAGAVAKIREAYNELTRRPLTKEQRKELEEIFKERSDDSKNKPKKSAKSGGQDAGLV